MSRLGKLPIKLGEGTQSRIEDGFCVIKGKGGELKEKIHHLVNVELGDKEIKVSVKNPEIKKQNALWGLFRSLIGNMVEGVEKGFEKKMEINGVGFKAVASGQKLILNVGFSHPVEFILPEGTKGQVEGNIITISGIGKQLVGETAARIRKIKLPEPYKGKGIKYIDEVIIKKIGKTAAKGA